MEAIAADPDTAAVGDRRRAMLDYALKLSRRPSSVGANDVEALRDAGFADADVLAIAQVTAYYAYANRIADGLGVEVESWVRPPGGER